MILFLIFLPTIGHNIFYIHVFTPVETILEKK